MEIRQADPSRDLAVIRALWSDYLDWVNGELGEAYGISFPIGEILERNLADLTPFVPPRGRLLLADEVGIGCLQPIGEDIGEIKRMYVRPEARGAGVGSGLLAGLLDAAGEVGYRRVRLDSVRFMAAAHALYRTAGFVDIPRTKRARSHPSTGTTGSSWNATCSELSSSWEIGQGLSASGRVALEPLVEAATSPSNE